MLTQEALKELLHYDPETGLFSWLVSSRRKRPTVGTLDKGYRKISVNFIGYRAHRLAFLYMTGSFPAEYVDHINGNRDDNRWCNLRAVSQSENMRNMKMPFDNTSGYIGVSRRCNKEWQVRATKKNKYFSDKNFGGENLSFMAACFYASRVRSEQGFHENHGRLAVR